MTPVQREEIRDFVDTLVVARPEGGVCMGTVIVSPREQGAAVAVLDELGVPLFVLDDVHPGVVLQGMAAAFRVGRGVALVVGKALPPAVWSALRSVRANVFDAWLPGETSRAFLRPGPRGAFVLLLVTPESEQVVPPDLPLVFARLTPARPAAQSARSGAPT